MKRIKCFN